MWTKQIKESYVSKLKKYVCRFILLAIFAVILAAVCKIYNSRYAGIESKIEQIVVSGLQVSDKEGHIELQWNEVSEHSEIDGYRVFRRIDQGNFEYVDSTDQTEFVDNEAVAGVYNYYRVYPYKEVNGKTIIGQSENYVYIKP